MRPIRILPANIETFTYDKAGSCHVIDDIIGCQGRMGGSPVWLRGWMIKEQMKEYSLS